jgi:Tol biopolymer transport system component
LGTEDCSYPSSNAAVFVTTVDQKSQARASAASPAFQPTFSRDGSAILFVDSSQFPNRIFRYELAGGARELVRQAGVQENTYELLGCN